MLFMLELVIMLFCIVVVYDIKFAWLVCLHTNARIHNLRVSVVYLPASWPHNFFLFSMHPYWALQHNQSGNRFFYNSVLNHP